MKFLVTGAAGFIGFHISKRLLQQGHQVIGIDNLNDYYDVNLKRARLNLLISDNFIFQKLDLTDREGMIKLFAIQKFDRVIHLAAQVGVHFSLKSPHTYIESNLAGYLNVLEGCRCNKVQYLMYASSSSVYGLKNKIPFSVNDSVDHPTSLYAATKKSNELMSHVYSHLYNLPTIGLRFFTVYGPWGRPDMALFKFTKAIIEDKSINIYNYGKIKRDFTYIDDITEAIMLLQNFIPRYDASWNVENSCSDASSAPYRIYNIGNNKPVELIDCISFLEKILGKKVKKNMMPARIEDIPETSADTSELYKTINFRPQTLIKKGLKNFVNWYCNFYNIRNKFYRTN